MKHIIDDDDKNKYEAYTKEETLQVIQEAISSGELPEEINGLVLTFKNPVDNLAYKIAFCTQAKYNELEESGSLETNCIYYITDDTTADDISSAITNLTNEFESLQAQLIDGVNKVKMEVNNTDGLRYILTTANSSTSGGNQTPQYSPLFYIKGDNNGLFLLDDFNAQDFYYWDSDEAAYISVKEKLNEKKYVHNISFIEYTNYVYISLIYISNSQTPLTQSTILSTLAGGTYSVSGRKSNNQVYKATITSSQIILYGYEDAEYVVDMTLVYLTDYVYEI